MGVTEQREAPPLPAALRVGGVSAPHVAPECALPAQVLPYCSGHVIVTLRHPLEIPCVLCMCVYTNMVMRTCGRMHVCACEYICVRMRHPVR